MAILLRLVCIFCLLLASTSIAWGVCAEARGNFGGPPSGEHRFLPFTPVEGPYPLVFYLLAERERFFICAPGCNDTLKWDDLEPVFYLGELRLEGSGRVTFAPPDGPQPLEEQWVRALLAEMPVGESPQQAWEAFDYLLGRISNWGTGGVVVLMVAPGQMPPPGYRPEILTPLETEKWYVTTVLKSVTNPLPGMRVFTERFYEYTAGERRK